MTPHDQADAEHDDTAALSLTQSPRLRRSPYFAATVAHGVRAFTVYNHMLLPTEYAGAGEEYRTLVDAVTVWDVAAQRQVEITGPDAGALVQYLITRDVDAIAVGRARYTLLCNPDGGIINDPVLLRLSPDRFWLSLADRDILLWAQAVAHERGLDVVVEEPDVAPLQIQGPSSADLVRDLLGEEVVALPYYGLTEVALDGVPLVVSRTGWSGELGFEIFLLDGSMGGWLWDRVFAAGERYGVEPAAPNQIRRIEAGILSYGTDMDDTTNPYELGLDRFVDLDGADDFIGREALRGIRARGPARRLVGLLVDGPPIASWHVPAAVVASDSEVGSVTSLSHSPRFEKNLGLALVATDAAIVGRRVDVALDDGTRSATVVDLPFVTSVR